MFARLEDEGIIEGEGASNNAKGRRVLIHLPEEPQNEYENLGSIEQTTIDYSK